MLSSWFLLFTFCDHKQLTLNFYHHQQQTQVATTCNTQDSTTPSLSPPFFALAPSSNLHLYTNHSSLNQASSNLHPCIGDSAYNNHDTSPPSSPAHDPCSNYTIPSQEGATSTANHATTRVVPNLSRNDAGHKHSDEQKRKKPSAEQR